MPGINYPVTKDHWVCKTLSHDWLVDIACPSGYSLKLITRRGGSHKDLTLNLFQPFLQ